MCNISRVDTSFKTVTYAFGDPNARIDGVQAKFQNDFECAYRFRRLKILKQSHSMRHFIVIFDKRGAF